MTPSRVTEVVKAWRKSHDYADNCSMCSEPLKFGQDWFHKPIESQFYTTCCDLFYFNRKANPYQVQSIAVPTPGYEFLLPHIKRAITQAKIQSDQNFLILPDPIYWQVTTTLIYEKIMKFVTGIPLTKKTERIEPASKANIYYEEIQQAPLNYGSYQKRSVGKSTFIRQIGLGKRTTLAMRGMIVPDPSLSPNQIRLPIHIVKEFGLANKWIILNRMPSLQPGNFVGLKVVPEGWPYNCFGIPLEIVQAMNADFDGDECNVYVVLNAQSQAEVMTILGSKWNMGCFVMGIKLAPSQDMLAAYYLFYDQIDFLPYKNRDLNKTMKVIYDLYGSEKCFEAFDMMRKFYRKAFQNKTCFALTLKEMKQLYKCGRESQTVDEFEEKIKSIQGCLVTQVQSGAKGSIEHLYQMFGQVGWQNENFVASCFFKGLNPVEFAHHAITANEAMRKMGKIWEPGYSYSKSVFNLQGLHVDYLGQLMDGDVVVEKDVLNVLHHTDLISEVGFAHLVDTFFNNMTS